MKTILIVFVAMMIAFSDNLFASCSIATVSFSRNLGTPCMITNNGNIANRNGGGCVRCFRVGLLWRWRDHPAPPPPPAGSDGGAATAAAPAPCTDPLVWGTPPTVRHCDRVTTAICQGSRHRAPGPGMSWVRGSEGEPATCWNVGCAAGTYFRANVANPPCIPCVGGIHRRIAESWNMSAGTVILAIQSR